MTTLRRHTRINVRETRLPDPIREYFQICVDYKTSLWDLMATAKLRPFPADEIAVVFQGNPSKEIDFSRVSPVNVVTVGFDGYVTDDAALTQICDWGYRPATARENVALVMAHPDILVDYCVLSHGTGWEIRGQTKVLQSFLSRPCSRGRSEETLLAMLAGFQGNFGRIRWGKERRWLAVQQ